MERTRETLKDKINIKNIIIMLAVFFVLCVFGSFIVKNSAVNKNQVTGFSTDKTLTYFGYNNIYGYDVDGRVFTVSDEDPHIYYYYLDVKVDSIRIKFREPLEETLPIQVYYVARDGALNEKDSVFKWGHKGDDEVYIDIPYIENCDILRFDIDGDFILDKINLSETNFIIENAGRYEISVMAYVVMAVIMLVISWIIVFCLNIWGRIKNAVKRIRNIKLNKITILKIVSLSLIWVIYIISVIYINNELSDNKYVKVFYDSLLFSAIIIIINAGKIKKRIAGIVFSLIMAVGICYIYTLPMAMLVGPDDEIHYERSAYLSHIFDGKMTEADEYIYMRKVLTDYDMNNIGNVADRLEYMYLNGEAFDMREVTPSAYSIIGYVPFALAMFVGRGLGLSFIHIFIAGKFVNLFVYALLIYFSIRRLKSGKLIGAVIGMFPTNIFLACTYSCDTWITGFLMLGVSYIIGAVQSKEASVTIKDMIIILGAFVIGCAPKAIYFPFILLALIIPADRFKSKKHRKIFKWGILICTFAVLLSFMLPFLANGSSRSDVRGGSDVNAVEQVKFILLNPLEYTKILINHIINYISIGNQYMTAATYTYMGDSKHFVLIVAILAMAVFCDRSKFDREINTVKVKAYAAAIIFVTIALISTSLYVSFTPVANSVINGCQYRYLLPLIFPAAYFLANVKMVNKGGKNIIYTLAMICMVGILYSDAWDLWVNMYY